METMSCLKTEAKKANPGGGLDIVNFIQPNSSTEGRFRARRRHQKCVLNHVKAGQEISRGPQRALREDFSLRGRLALGLLAADLKDARGRRDASHHNQECSRPRLLLPAQR